MANVARARRNLMVLELVMVSPSDCHSADLPVLLSPAVQDPAIARLRGTT
ncbi:hypothetical protein [Croceibacterium ferulae]|nr:hypothetical protein [Croceibacterium ferulae]